MTTRCARSGCSPARSPTRSVEGRALATEQDFAAERIVTDETPLEEIPENTQYFDPRYAEQLMSESLATDERPAVGFPAAQGPRFRDRRRGCRPGYGRRYAGRQAVGRDCQRAERLSGAFAGFNFQIQIEAGSEMAEITAQQVKELRERTGAGMMECKSALAEAKGDLAEAEVVLRKRGIASAAKKASRTTKQGMIGSYIHPGSQLGVLVEVNCESDFVARTDDFQQLVHDIAMQIAAADPQFLRKEDVTPEVLEKETRDRSARGRSAKASPRRSWTRSSKAGWRKFYEEVCLYEQPFIKDNTLTVGQLIATKIAKIGENISVSRFSRFKLGDQAGTPAPEA